MTQISLKGASTGVELGECVYLFDQPNSLLTVDGMTFLKSGSQLKNEAANYPEVFARYQVNGNRTIPAGAWTVQGSTGLGTVALVCVTFGNNIYMGVGTDGYSYTSVDGKVWATKSVVSSAVTSIAYGNGAFVCASGGTTYRSLDNGTTWITTSCAGSKILFDAGSGAFYLSVGTPFVWRSTDGVSWAQGSAVVTGGSDNVTGFTVSNGFVLATGYYTSGSISLLYSSSDRATWTQVANTGAGVANNSVVNGSTGVIVLTGSSGTTGTGTTPFIKYSINSGSTFTQASIAFSASETLAGSYYWPGVYLVVGNSGTMASSPDGINWTRVAHGLGTVNLLAVATDNVNTLVTGAQGLVATAATAVDKLVGLTTPVAQLHMRIK